MRAAEFSARVFRGALDLLLPPACLTCDAAVDRPGQFCAACFNLTNFIGDPQCRRCGVPFDFAAPRAQDCDACLAHPPLYGRARSALLYDEHSKRIVLAFKHADRTETAGALALHMARAGATLLREADVLVPVPLHRWRLLKRRYNQAALLARALHRLSGLPVLPDGLQRVRPTVALGTHDAAARRRILQGTIIVRPHRRNRIAGKRVLLIDDVLTSGATAETCAAALIAAGAAGIDVLAAARVPREQD